jgi:hypothetical protein
MIALQSRGYVLPHHVCIGFFIVRTSRVQTHLLDLLRLLRCVLAAFATLDLLDHLVDGLGLLVPLALAHLELLLEQLVVWLPVAATQTVPESGELAIVVVEVQVVHCVASSTVDDGGVVCVFTIVNQDGPNVDEDEEGDRGDLGQGKEEGEHVVWQALSVTIQWMESVRCERGRHDPLVVRLVDVLVDARVVQATVDPVDEGVGEHQEERELCIVIPSSRALLSCVVELRVAAHFSEEPGNGEYCHDGESGVGLLHLELDLVLEVSRVLECRLVED